MLRMNSSGHVKRELKRDFSIRRMTGPGDRSLYGSDVALSVPSGRHFDSKSN